MPLRLMFMVFETKLIYISHVKTEEVIMQSVIIYN